MSVHLEIAPVKREEDEDEEKYSVDVDTPHHHAGLSAHQPDWTADCSQTQYKQFSYLTIITRPTLTPHQQQQH